MTNCIRFLCLVLFCFSAQAAELYVDNGSTGCASPSDTGYTIATRTCGAGAETVYDTIQGAENAGSAGDTVHIRAGTYRVHITFQDNNGTVGNPITFQSYLSESVSIKPLSGTCDTWSDLACGPLFELRTVDYLVFDGLDFDGEASTNCTIANGCQPTRSNWQGGHMGIGTRVSVSSNVTVSNSTFTDFGHAGVKGDAIWLLEYNIIHDLGIDNQDHAFYGSSNSSGILRYNHIYTITGYAFHNWSTSDANPVEAYQIYNNIVQDWGNLAGAGSCVIQRGDDLEFYGNICDGGPRGITSPRAANTGWIIKNNVFMNLGIVLQIERSETLSATFDTNYYDAFTLCAGCNATNGTDGYITASTGTLGKPTFVAPTPAVPNWFDYRMASGSGAVDTGTTLPETYDDALDPADIVWPPSIVDQDDYGTGWERGAFVFGAVNLGGTLSDGATESEIVSGGETLLINLSGDTWVAAGATFDAQRQNIIDGIVSAGSETTGWNNEVKANMAVTEVVRTSATRVTVTFAAQAGYDITMSEAITVTVPATAMVIATVDPVAVPAGIIVPSVVNTLAMQFTGIITGLDDAGGFLPAAIELGDQATGSFTYLTTLTDRDASSNYGDYRASASPGTFTLTVEGYTWQPATRYTVQKLIRNDAAGDMVAISMRGIDFPDGIDHASVSTNPNNSFMQVILEDSTAAALSSTALPTSLTLAPWDSKIVSLTVTTNTSTGAFYRILIETLQSLVEP